jgi:ArsR family transcriptional regulator
MTNEISNKTITTVKSFDNDEYCCHVIDDKTIIDDSQASKLAMFFSIFSDKTRIKIIDILIDGEYCVHEIAHILGASQSSISHQLKNLRQINLVSVRKVGKHSFYSLKSNHIKEIFQQGLKMMEVNNA